MTPKENRRRINLYRSEATPVKGNGLWKRRGSQLRRRLGRPVIQPSRPAPSGRGARPTRLVGELIA